MSSYRRDNLRASELFQLLMDSEEELQAARDENAQLKAQLSHSLGCELAGPWEECESDPNCYLMELTTRAGKLEAERAAALALLMEEHDAHHWNCCVADDLCHIGQFYAALPPKEK